MFTSGKKREQCVGNFFPSTWHGHLYVEADAQRCGNHLAPREMPLRTQRSQTDIVELLNEQAHKLATSRFLVMGDLLPNPNCWSKKENSAIRQHWLSCMQKGVKEPGTFSYYRLCGHPSLPHPSGSFISASHPPPPVVQVQSCWLTLEMPFWLAGRGGTIPLYSKSVPPFTLHTHTHTHHYILRHKCTLGKQEIAYIITACHRPCVD